MKTSLRLLAVLPFFCLLSPVMAKDSAACRLKIELRDGTRVIGQSENETFRFTSPLLGDIRLAPSQIVTWETLARTNLVRLTSTGGDVLTLQPAMTELKVKTSFGRVEIPMDQIRSLRVSAIGKAGRPVEGLLGWWRGNGNTADSTGDNPGAIQNGSYCDGVSGQAFSFAPDDFPYGTWTGVKVADRPEYALTRALTIEGWVRPRGNGYIIFFRGDHRPGLDPYCLSMQANQVLRFVITDEAGTSATVDTQLPYGRWTHVAAVFDGEAGTMNLFTNGQLAAQSPTSVRPFARLQPEQWPGVGIGNVNDGGNNFPFIGDIDEISLYGRALTPEEVLGLYQENAANADQTAEMRPPRNGFGIPPVRIRSGFQSGQIID